MLEERLNKLYEGYGYRKFRMSKFEEYDLYAKNKDFLKSGHIITFTDVDGSLKALKPDITLSIMKNNNGGSEKVYYNENVYRDMGGSFQEILQVGVESVGRSTPTPRPRSSPWPPSLWKCCPPAMCWTCPTSPSSPVCWTAWAWGEGAGAGAGAHLPEERPRHPGQGIEMAQAIGAATVDMDQIQIHPTVEANTAA